MKTTRTMGELDNEAQGAPLSTAQAAHLDQLDAAYRDARAAALMAARKAAEVDRLAAEGQGMGLKVKTMAARLGIAGPRVSIRVTRHWDRVENKGRRPS